MIPYYPIPPLHLGFLTLNLYGISYALGILVAIILAKKEAKRRNISSEMIEELSIYLILGIVIGARAFYDMFFWPPEIPRTFIGLFAVWQGGMAFFGGLVGALIVGYVYTKKKKLDFMKLLDLFTMPVLVGHIIGRFGAFLMGNQPGKIVSASFPLAIYLQGAYRHPVELYDVFGLLVILGIIYFVKKKFKLKKGVLFSLYVILYGIERFVFVDPFRTAFTDPRYYGFTASQYLIVVLVIGAGIYIFKKENILKLLKNKIRI